MYLMTVTEENETKERDSEKCKMKENKKPFHQLFTTELAVDKLTCCCVPVIISLIKWTIK